MRGSRLRMIAIGFGFACVAGCPALGDGADAGAGPSGSDDNGTRACGAWLEWEKRCAGVDGNSGSGPLFGEAKCPNSIPWRYAQEPYVEALVECFDTLSCQSSDDHCGIGALDAVGVDVNNVQNDPDYGACTQRVNNCGTLNDDLCTVVLPLTDTGKGLVAQCLESDCDAIESCIEDL